MKMRLADVADVRTGYPFRGKVWDDPAGNLAVVQIKDISDVGHLKPDGCLRIAEESAHTKHLLRQGDVLLQSRGINFPSGVVDMPIHGIAALGLHVIRPDVRQVLPEYVAWVMNQPSSREALKNMARGSSVPFVSKQDLAEFQLPVPSLKMQHQIVEVARLEREVTLLSVKLHKLRTEYIAAAAWRAASRSEGKKS